MIHENYISFDVAKLLKEKGFDEGCSFVVNADKLLEFVEAGMCYSKLCADSEPVSKDLDEEIENYIKDSLAIKFPTTDKEQIKADIRYIARHFAEWQKQQSKCNIKWKKRKENGYEGENGLCQMAPFGYVLYDETHYIPLDDLEKLPRE